MQHVPSRYRGLVLAFAATAFLTALGTAPALACGSCIAGGPHLGSGDSTLLMQLAAGGSAGVIAALKIWWHQVKAFVTRQAPDLDGQPTA